jgi:hypothetical protein
MRDPLRILRYEIEADDRWHTLPAGRIVHVGTRHEDRVEVWVLTPRGLSGYYNRKVRVFGTGDELPETGEHLGSVITPSGKYVWHLIEDLAAPAV